MILLAWLGRQRSRAIAALVLLGILLPPVGAVLKPCVTAAVVGLLCISFLRIDSAAIQRNLRHPGILLVAVAWTSVVTPMIVLAIGWAFGLDRAAPSLFTGLMLQTAAPPMMAAPAFAALMGLDATLVLVTMVACTTLTPFSVPLFASAAGLDLSLSPISLGLKLLVILGGAAMAGLGLRRCLGAAVIVRYRDEIDGINILLLFVFVSAVMGEMGTRFLTEPLMMLGLTVLAFAVFALLLGATCAVFFRAGAKHALALGMMASQRNLGLMLAATGGLVPDGTWMFVAVSQFPIYLSPLMLQPLARVIDRKTA